MDKLLQNAVDSIQIGVEDYQSADPRRGMSAARNFFSGILLLAKRALVSAAPGSDPRLVLAARTRPVSDGSDGVKYVPVGSQTIDFSELGTRLKEFEIQVDQAALRDLNRIRNEIEHLYTDQPAQAVRAAISKAFPVVADLCRYLEMPPGVLLGGAWTAMIGVKEMYDAELIKCMETFREISLPSDLLSGTDWTCPSCGSQLVRQDDPENSDHEQMQATCQACGGQADGAALVACLVEEQYGVDGKDGETVFSCPECRVDAYVAAAGISRCAYCGNEMGECGLCGCGLTPDNVSWGKEDLCGHCGYVLSRD